jgi:hypothetical protein
MRPRRKTKKRRRAVSIDGTAASTHRCLTEGACSPRSAELMCSVDPLDTDSGASATRVTLLQLARGSVAHFNKQNADARESARKFTAYLPLTARRCGLRSRDGA